MKQQKPFIDKLRRELKEHGVYQPKNELLIISAARCLWMISIMEEELKGHSLILRQTGCQGQEKIMQHPHVETIRKMNSALAYCLNALGLGNEKTIEQTENSALERFLSEIE